MKKLNVSLPLLFGCGVLALGIFAIDIQIPLGVAGGVPYVTVVLVSAWFPDRRLIFLAATFCTLLTYVGFELSPEGGEPWKVVTNRALSVVAIWGTALLVYQRKSIEGALRGLNDELEDRTHQLKAANEQLSNFIDWEESTKEKIQEKEFRYRTLFTQCPDAIVLINPETTLPMEFNDVAPRLLGHTPEEFKNLRVEDYEAQESREEIRAHVEKVLRLGEDSFETKLRTKDGQIRDFHINIRVIELGGKRVFHNIFRDITETKSREVELQESQAQLQGVLDNSPGMIFIKDLQGRYLNCNRQFLNTFHFTPENVLGKTDDQIFPSDQAAQYQKNDQKVMRAESAIQFEETAHHNDGIHTSVVNKFPLRNNRGEFYAICGITADITKHKQADKELQESEERLRQISETIEDVFWITDWETQNVLYASRAYERIWGRSLHELYADPLNWIGAVLPEDRKKVWENFLSLGEGDTYDEGYRIMRPDGSIRWIRDRGFPILDSCGKIYRVTGVAQDITVRKEAEEALKRTEHMYHQILDAIPDLVFVKNPDSRLVWANKAFSDYYGMTGKQLKGLIDAPINKPEYTEQYLKDDDYVLQTGETLQNSDEPITRHNGDVRYFHTIKSPILDEYKEVRMIVGVARDITDRKEAEKCIETQAQIIDQIHDSVVSTDLEGYVTSWNKGAERLFGFFAHEALGQHISFVYPEEEHEFLESQVIFPLKEKGEHEVEVRMLKKSGEEFHAHLSLDMLKDEKGIPRSMIGYSLDISERKRIEETLRKFEKIMNCSHDLVSFVDKDMVFQAVNTRVAEMYGIPQCDIVGKHFSELKGKVEFGEAWARKIQQGLSGERFTFEQWMNFPGNVRWFMETHIDPFYEKDGRISGVVVQGRDITERHEMESLKAQYLNKVLSAQEDERARIARELHDETGQSLTALLIGLRTLDAVKGSSAEMKERIEYLRSLTSNTIEEVQRLAMGLRPLVLDDLGLQVALERYCREYAKLYHIKVNSDIKIVDSDRLPRDIETALFRIFQEAFTNIAKHANAKHIHVGVRFEDQFIHMVIKDDGGGFTLKDSGMETGLKSQLGLHGMRQRATMVGGELTVESIPEKGTTITVGIPLGTGTLT